MITAVEQTFIDEHLNPGDHRLSPAVYRPLAELVKQVVRPPDCNEQTARSYRLALGLFLQYLESVCEQRMPSEIGEKWRPFAVKTLIGRRVAWHIRPPSAVLRWIEPATLEGYIAWCIDRGDSQGTIRVRVSAVKVLLRTALDAGVLGWQQMKEVNLPCEQLGQELPEQQGQSATVASQLWLSEAQVRLLRGVVDPTTNRGRRDLALIDSLLYLGLRPDELRSLKWGDFDTSDEAWQLTLKRDRRGERFCLPVHSMLKLSLAAWFWAIEFWQRPSSTHLFLNVDQGDSIGRRVITTAAIDLIINQYGKLANIVLPKGRERLNAGTLRRTCGRCAYDNGASLRQVQHLLGLSTLQLTANFIGALDSDESTATEYIHYY